MPGQALFHQPQPLKRAHFIARSFTQILFLLICVCLGRKKFLSILVTTKESHRNPGPGFQHLCPLDDITCVNISRSSHCVGLPFRTCGLSPTAPLLPVPQHTWVPQICSIIKCLLMFPLNNYTRDIKLEFHCFCVSPSNKLRLKRPGEELSDKRAKSQQQKGMIGAHFMNITPSPLAIRHDIVEHTTGAAIPMRSSLEK